MINMDAFKIQAKQIHATYTSKIRGMVPRSATAVRTMRVRTIHAHPIRRCEKKSGDHAKFRAMWTRKSGDGLVMPR